MLARRVVTQPVATIRRGSQLQRRFIHPSRPQLQTPPRPNTWLAKIRFRADGKPRSKRIAFGFGFLILLNLLSLRALSFATEDGTINGNLMAKLIYLQQIDFTYDSVNFDDPISTLSYFKKLFQSFTRTSDEKVEKMFEDMMGYINERSKDGSINYTEVQAQHIMKAAAEKIHTAFQELNRDSLVVTARFVFQVMIETVDSLIDLIHDREGDDDLSRFKFTLQRKHDKKEGGLKDYEVLGG